MSTTIDNRVVEMQFDNRHFEKNVATSMSTLEKLKKSLNLTGAAKGLEGVTSAAKRVDLSSISRSADTVGLRFNALYTVADQALRNITTSAMNAGKRIVSALTIDPVHTGFSEYELKMGSIQTIMASTGEDLKTVNEYLNELNKYSDKTIYSFSDMTQNIGKFTNAGVKLEDAVMAIKGISNEAAVSGANANEASRAMYNFAQALSAGYVKLIDWKSIELANMATMEFKNQLIATALELGTIVEQEGKYVTTTTDANGSVSDLFDSTKNFNESLSHQWMTTDVLVKTLSKYADETTDIGKKAYAAAQDVKTLSQLFDTLKEAAQSGWAQTWELIVGDFEEAKNLFTTLSKSIGGFIDKMSDSRNELLGGALDSKWTQLIKKINDAGVSTEDFETSIKNVLEDGGEDVDDLIKKYGSLEKAFTSGDLDSSYLVAAIKDIATTAEDGGSKLGDLASKLEYYQEVVDKVWHGDYDIMEERKRLLKEAGYDAEYVQKLVNKSVKDGEVRKLTVEDLTEAYAEMSDAELKSIGYTEDEIKALRELAKAAEETGTPLSELIKDISKKDGRTLLFEAFGNAFSGIKTVLTQIGTAWRETFSGIQSHHIYNAIEAINKLSQHLIVGDETAEKVLKTFRGLFAILDLVTTIAGGGLKIAFKTLTTILGYFDMDILDVTAHIGDAIVGFRDWLEPMLDVTNVLEKIPGFVSKAVKAIKGWISSIGAKIDLPPFITDMLDTIGAWADSFKGSDNIGRDLVLGLAEGLKKGAKAVWDAAVEVATEIWEAITDWWIIRSPSRRAMEIGEFIIQGLINGIVNGAKVVWSTMKTIGQSIVNGLKDNEVTSWLKSFGSKIKDILGSIVDYISKIDLGTVFAAALGVGMLYTVNKITDTLQMFAAPLEAFAGVGESISGVLDAWKENIEAEKLNKKAEAIYTIAKAIGVFALAMFIIASLDATQLKTSLAVMAGIIVVLGVLVIALNKVQGLDIKIAASSASLVGIAAALLILSFALSKVAKVAGMDDSAVANAIMILIGMALALSTLLAVFGNFIKGNVAKDILKIGVMLMLVSSAMVIMTKVIEKAAGISEQDLFKGLAVVAAITTLFAALTIISMFSGKNAAKAGIMCTLMSTALLAMLGVVKIASMLDPADAVKGIATVGLISTLFGLLTIISLFAGKNAAKAGIMMMGMSVALGIAVTVVKQASKLKSHEVKSGIDVMSSLVGLFAALVAASFFAGEHAIKAGIMLLTMSGAMLILTGVLFIVSKIAQHNPEGLKRAVDVITTLELLFIGLIAVTKLVPAKGLIGPIIAITAAISVMAIAITALTVLASSDNGGNLAKATAALSAVMLAFGLMVKMASAFTKAKGLVGTIITLTIVAGLFGGLIYALSFTDTSKALKNSAAIGLLLMAFATSFKILGETDRILPTVSKQLLTMAGIAMAFTVMIGALSYTDSSKAIPNATALSILLNAFSLSLVILGKSHGITKTASAALLPMTTVVAGLAIILGIMSLMGIEASINNAVALGVLVNAMSIAMVILGHTGSVAQSAINGMLTMTLVIGLLGIILGGMQALNIEADIETALSLSALILALSGAVAILSAVGPMAVAADAALIALGKLILGAGGLLVLVGAIEAAGGDLTGFIEKGAPILCKVGEAIGDFLGSILAGFGEGLTSTLPAIGENLSGFMDKAGGFFEGMTALSGTDVTTFSTFIGSINSLVTAGILDTVFGWFTGKSSLSDFGDSLSVFADGLVGYANKITGVDFGAVESSTTAATLLSELENGLPKHDGLVQKWFGDNNLSNFAGGLGDFADGIVDYAEAVTGVDFSNVEASAAAGKLLSELENSLPKHDGLVQEWFGDNDLSNFAGGLTDFAEGIVGYAKEVTGVDFSNVEASAAAGTLLSELEDSLPEHGGILQGWFGDNDLSNFAGGLGDFADGIVDYADKVKGSDFSGVEDSAKAGTLLSNLANSLPEYGGRLTEWFGGEKVDLETFGEQIVAFADSLVSYSSKIAGVDTNIVTNTSNAVSSLVTIANGLPEDKLFKNETTIDEFGEDLADFGESFSSYYSEIKGIDTTQLSSVIDGFGRIVLWIKGLSGLDTSGIATFKTALEDLADVGISGFISTHTDWTTAVNTGINSMLGKFTASEESFRLAGVTIALKVAKGISENTNYVATRAESMVSAASGKVGTLTQHQEFYEAGAYLVDGFAAGITAETFAAKAAATAMANAALKAAEEALDENSPSEEGVRIGKFFTMGVANGITKLADMVYDNSYEVASYAKTGLSEAMSKIRDFVDSDMDTQPTIRPVLDLTAVEAGAGTIGNLFGDTSVGVLANVRGISSMMNHNRQNGVNDDVVHELKKLRGELGNVGGTQYNINGVTYDDGSNISEAVKTIVRATRIERRT